MPFCTKSNCANKKLDPLVMVKHHIHKDDISAIRRDIISIFEKKKTKSSYETYKKIKTAIVDSSVWACVRTENQIYTSGDMSLSHVKVVKADLWYKHLKGIKCDIMDEYIKEEYKTVLHVSLDTSNDDAAIFTLSQYIIAHLENNLVITEEEFSPPRMLVNKIILHIKMSNGLNFSEFFNNLEKKGTEGFLGEKVKAKMNDLKGKFKQWKDELDRIIPVEVIGNIMEVIRL